MTNRVLVQVSPPALKVTKPGRNVLTATDPRHFLINTQFAPPVPVLSDTLFNVSPGQNTYHVPISGSMSGYIFNWRSLRADGAVVSPSLNTRFHGNNNDFAPAIGRWMCTPFAAGYADFNTGQSWAFNLQYLGVFAQGWRFRADNMCNHACQVRLMILGQPN